MPELRRRGRGRGALPAAVRHAVPETLSTPSAVLLAPFPDWPCVEGYEIQGELGRGPIHDTFRTGHRSPREFFARDIEDSAELAVRPGAGRVARD